MNTTPVTATVADAQTNEQVTLTASAVSEGSVANYTFTATLADPAHNTPVTVTILDGNNVSHVITIAVGQTTGHVDIASGNGEDVYVDPTSLKAHITNVTGGNFEHPVYSSSDVTATVADTINDVTATLTTSALNISETGGSGSYTVALAGGPGAVTPQSDLTFTLASGDTITLHAGQSSGSVTHTYSDADITNQVSITNSITGITEGTQYEHLVTAGTTGVPVIYSPVGAAASALVDDDGLANGIAGGTGDNSLTNLATFHGTFTASGGTGSGYTFNFANLAGQSATVGQETVDFTWASNKLTATVDGGSRDEYHGRCHVCRRLHRHAERTGHASGGW